MSCCNDPCVSVEDLIETTIKKYIENGLLSPGLLSCEGENKLKQDDRLVLCTELVKRVQEAIEAGEITTGAIKKLELDESTLIITADDGTTHSIDLLPLLDKVPKIQKVTVNPDGNLVITLSDGSTITSDSSLKKLVYGQLQMCDGTVNGENTKFVSCDYLSQKIELLSDDLKTYVANLVREAFRNQYHNVLTDNSTILGNGLEGGAIRLNEEWLLEYIDTWIKTYIPAGGTYGQVLTYDKNNRPKWVSLVDCENQAINLVLTPIATCADLKKSVPDTVAPGGVLTQDDDGNKKWAHLKDCKGNNVDVNKTAIASCVDLKEAVPDGGTGGNILGKDDAGKSVWFTPLDCAGQSINLLKIKIATCADLHALVPTGGTGGQILIKDADGNSKWVKPKDCKEQDIDLSTVPIATCADLKDVFPDGGTTGDVLTIGPDGKPIWKKGLPEGGTDGQFLVSNGDGTASWKTYELDLEAGDGILVDGSKVSVDPEWISKQIAKLLCGSYMECGTWIYTSNRDSIPILDGTSIYYVTVEAGNDIKTSWFGGGGTTGCYDYDAIIGTDSARFVLRLDGEQYLDLSAQTAGAVAPKVTVTKMRRTADEQPAGRTPYSQRPDATNQTIPTLNGVTVTPTARIHPPGGNAGTLRPDKQRWFYRVQLTTPIPAGHYYGFIQADDSLNITLSGTTYDTGLKDNGGSNRDWYFEITSTGVTTVLYANNYNSWDGRPSQAFFTLILVDDAGNIAFNSEDSVNQWYVSQTDLTCDNIITS